MQKQTCKLEVEQLICLYVLKIFFKKINFFTLN